MIQDEGVKDDTFLLADRKNRTRTTLDYVLMSSHWCGSDCIELAPSVFATRPVHSPILTICHRHLRKASPLLLDAMPITAE